MPQARFAKLHCSGDRRERLSPSRSILPWWIIQVTGVSLSICLTDIGTLLFECLSLSHINVVLLIMSACSVRMMCDASLAAWMANSQCSWCRPVAVASSLKLYCNRNQSSLLRPSEPLVSWCSTSLSSSSLGEQNLIEIFMEITLCSGDMDGMIWTMMRGGLEPPNLYPGKKVEGCDRADCRLGQEMSDVSDEISEMTFSTRGGIRDVTIIQVCY